MKLKLLDVQFSVCKIKNIEDVNFKDEFVFLSKTDEELSLVCNTKYVPDDYIEAENGWRAFRIEGVLDFSLVGILSDISTVLARYKISIFAVSTFNTDYILIKEDSLEEAVRVLEKNNYKFS